ncbi:MAG: M48 family metallopeptidase [Vicinamibacterales bacterium]
MTGSRNISAGSGGPAQTTLAGAQLRLPFQSPPCLADFVIHFVRVRRARRYVMRVRPDGALRVTIPRGGSRAEALRFAERHLSWAERQRAHQLAAARAPHVERALRTRAQRELPPQLTTLAERFGLVVSRISIRAQRSRWGACAPTGHITLNYRLLLMPPQVREYILIHELMHLRQPNHSRRFWRLVQDACPDFREAERWLKQHGASLM